MPKRVCRPPASPACMVRTKLTPNIKIFATSSAEVTGVSLSPNTPDIFLLNATSENRKLVPHSWQRVALIPTSATRCHECGTSLRFSLVALSKKISGVFGESETPVTSALLVANIMMLGVSLVLTMQAGEAGGMHTLFGMSGEASYRLGASHPYGIFVQHQWWRLVTAMFLHGGLIHIGFNMMSLLQLGPALEELYGSARYL